MTPSDKQPENQNTEAKPAAESVPADIQSRTAHESSATEETSGASSALPPWQRVANDAQHVEEQAVGDEPATAFENWGYSRSTQENSSSNYQAPAANNAERTAFVASAAAPGAESSGRTTVNLGAAARAATTPSALKRPGRGPRRASLQVKRVDPWSVLKLAFVLSVALFFVWMIAVAVLYGVLDGMGVWDRLNSTYNSFAPNTNSVSAGPLITLGRVFAITAVVGVINIVLFTALATIGAFVYNVSADLAGGLEVTLAERE